MTLVDKIEEVFGRSIFVPSLGEKVIVENVRTISFDAVVPSDFSCFTINDAHEILLTEPLIDEIYQAGK